MPAPANATIATAPAASYVQWRGIWAGAFIAVAISFVLIAFGSAVGLAVAPMTPTWRSFSVVFSILSGLWVLVVALGSMAAGGYVAGRTRTTWHITHSDEVEFRDGVHGLVVWAVSLTASALLSGASAAILAAAPVSAGGTPQPAGSGPVAYEVDRLFRPAQGAAIPGQLARDQASRALVAASGAGFTDDDRAELVGLVADTTRLAPDSAKARVDQSIASVRDKLRSARHAAIILAFIIAASAAASAAVAWQSASVGGRHRDAVA